MDPNEIKIKADLERQRLKELKNREPKKEFELKPPQLWYRIKDKFKRNSKFEGPLITFTLGAGFFTYLYFAYDGILNIYIAAVLLGLAIIFFIFLLIDKLRKGNKNKLLMQMEGLVDSVDKATKPLNQSVSFKKRVEDKQQYASNSFYVYRRIAPPTYRWFVWFFFVVAPGMSCIYFWMFEDTARWVLWLGVGIVSLLPVRMVAEYFIKKYRYRTYQNFQDQLGFRLTGWNKLGTDSDIFKNEYWVNCSMQVVLKDGANDGDIKLVNDALYLFSMKAHKWFYETMAGMNGRKEWTQPRSLETSGSANSLVFGEIFEFLQTHLKSIHSKYGIIDTVQINIGDVFFEVKGRRRVY